tara:strand:- start:3571 stop:5895 length:2325 start_codon:yes stop_codon:yes gene_type:complete
MAINVSGAARMVDVLISGYGTSKINSFVGVQSPVYNEYYHVSGLCIEGSGDQTKRYWFPTVSGIETSQHYLDLMEDRHCVSGVDWTNQCGAYTPSMTKPFALAGYPTNDLAFWRHYSGNLIDMGENVGRDFTKNPWAHYGADTEGAWIGYQFFPDLGNAIVSWSGDAYSPKLEDDFASSGKHSVPRSMFDHGPILRDDFHKFIVKPTKVDRPTISALGYYNRKKRITASGMGLLELPGTSGYHQQRSIGYTNDSPFNGWYDTLGGRGSPWGEDVEFTGFAGVSNPAPPGSPWADGPICMAYASNYKFTTAVDGNPAGYVEFPEYEVVDLSGRFASSGLVWVGGFTQHYEYENFYTSGDLDLWPYYEWALYNDSPQGSGTPSEYESSTYDWESFVTQGGIGLKGANQVNHQSVSNAQANDAVWRYGGLGVSLSEVWVPTVTSGLRGAVPVFSLNSEVKSYMGCFPLEGETLTKKGFRQLTGIITSGYAEMYGGGTLGGPSAGRPSRTGYGLPASHRGVTVDWGREEGDFHLNTEVILHGGIFDSSEDFIEYIRHPLDYIPITTMDWGPAVFASAWINPPKYLPPESGYIDYYYSGLTHVYNSHSHEDNPLLHQPTLPADWFGCEASGKFLGIGYYNPVPDSGKLQANCKKEFGGVGPIRWRSRIDGDVGTGIVLKTTGIGSWKVNNIASLGGTEYFDTGWSNWLYTGGIFGSGTNNQSVFNKKLMYPQVWRVGVFSIDSSSTPDSYMSLGGQGHLVTEPPHPIYASSDPSLWYRL